MIHTCRTHRYQVRTHEKVSLRKRVTGNNLVLLLLCAFIITLPLRLLKLAKEVDGPFATISIEKRNNLLFLCPWDPHRRLFHDQYDIQQFHPASQALKTCYKIPSLHRFPIASLFLLLRSRPTIVMKHTMQRDKMARFSY